VLSSLVVPHIPLDAEILCMGGGDMVLKEAAKVLKAAVKGSRVTVADLSEKTCKLAKEVRPTF
jgi:hypothetical protein